MLRRRDVTAYCAIGIVVLGVVQQRRAVRRSNGWRAGTVDVPQSGARTLEEIGRDCLVLVGQYLQCHEVFVFMQCSRLTSDACDDARVWSVLYAESTLEEAGGAPAQGEEVNICYKQRLHSLLCKHRNHMLTFIEAERAAGDCTRALPALRTVASALNIANLRTTATNTYKNLRLLTLGMRSCSKPANKRVTLTHRVFFRAACAFAERSKLSIVLWLLGIRAFSHCLLQLLAKRFPGMATFPLGWPEDAAVPLHAIVLRYHRVLLASVAASYTFSPASHQCVSTGGDGILSSTAAMHVMSRVLTEVVTFQVLSNRHVAMYIQSEVWAKHVYRLSAWAYAVCSIAYVLNRLRKRRKILLFPLGTFALVPLQLYLRFYFYRHHWTLTKLHAKIFTLGAVGADLERIAGSPAYRAAATYLVLPAVSAPVFRVFLFLASQLANPFLAHPRQARTVSFRWLQAQSLSHFVLSTTSACVALRYGTIKALQFHILSQTAVTVAALAGKPVPFDQVVAEDQPVEKKS
eukprot:Rhum_TRINITY_DN6292_c0_g1::Rhum_TRINITY_DN6292_c0_g1_i1::g.19375::m.19375